MPESHRFNRWEWLKVVIRQEGEIGEIHLPRMSSLIDREIVQLELITLTTMLVKETKLKEQ